MKKAAVWLLAWGAWLGVLTAVQAAFTPKLIQFGIPALASAACIASGLALWVSESRRKPRRGRSADP